MSNALTVKEVTAFILTGNLTREDRKSIIEAINVSAKMQENRARSSFAAGNAVKWHNARHNREVHGHIIQVNRRYIDVMDTGGTKWRVNPVLLEKR